MVDVTASVEVDQWLQGNLGLDILLCLCGCELLGRGIEAVDIGLVVVLVVQLHDLTGDRGFERAIVVCKSRLTRKVAGRIAKGEESSYMGGRGEWPCPERSWCLP